MQSAEQARRFLTTEDRVALALEEIERATKENKLPLSISDAFAVLYKYRLAFPYFVVNSAVLPPGGVWLDAYVVPSGYYWFTKGSHIQVQTQYRAAFVTLLNGLPVGVADAAASNLFWDLMEIPYGIARPGDTYAIFWTNLDLVNNNRVKHGTPGGLINEAVYEMLEVSYFKPMLDYMTERAQSKVGPFGVNVAGRPY